MKIFYRGPENIRIQETIGYLLNNVKTNVKKKKAPLILFSLERDSEKIEKKVKKKTSQQK